MQGATNQKRTRKMTPLRLFVCAATVLLLLLAGTRLLRLALTWYYPADLYETEIADACDRWGVPVSVAYAVIKSESDFDAAAVSKKGAVGLMQLMPDTFSWGCEMRGIPADSVQITDAETNIDAGVWYLSYLFAAYRQWDTVYAAYNAGQGRVDRWLAESADGATLTEIPYPETEKYVRSVSRARRAYARLYNME